MAKKSNPDAVPTNLRGPALAKRWVNADLFSWGLARALTEAQLLELWAWSVKRDKAYLQGKAKYESTKYELLGFELLRRGLLTPERLAEQLDLFDNPKRSDPLGKFMWFPLTLDLADEANASADLHRHAPAIAGAARAFLIKHAARFDPERPTEYGVLMLFGFGWSSELVPLLTTFYTAAREHLTKPQQPANLGSAIAQVLTGCPHVDPIIAVIEKAIGGKRGKTVVATAKAELANRRALLVATPARAETGAAVEQISWGRTHVRDAASMLERFANPTALIEQGLASKDPVVVLNAWSTAGWMLSDGKQLALSEQTLGAALVSLARGYTDKQPSGAALAKLLGYDAAPGRLFALGFDAAVARYATLWDRAAELYYATDNVLFKAWIERYNRLEGATVEDVPTRLTRLLASAAKDPKLADTVERNIVLRTPTSPGAKTINRLFGPPIGIDIKQWPKKGKAKLEHVITLETRLLSDAARASLPDKAAAVAVFVDSIQAGFERGVVVPLTKAQLAKGATAVTKGEGSIEAGYALDAIRISIPARVFQGGKKTGTLFELRRLLDRGDLLMPDRASPNWIQDPPQRDPGSFLFDLDQDFANELNLGDAGRMYVFDETAIMQCH